MADHAEWDTHQDIAIEADVKVVDASFCNSAVEWSDQVLRREACGALGHVHLHVGFFLRGVGHWLGVINQQDRELVRAVVSSGEAETQRKIAAKAGWETLGDDRVEGSKNIQFALVLHGSIT